MRLTVARLWFFKGLAMHFGSPGYWLSEHWCQIQNWGTLSAVDIYRIDGGTSGMRMCLILLLGSP